MIHILIVTIVFVRNQKFCLLDGNSQMIYTLSVHHTTGTARYSNSIPLGHTSRDVWPSGILLLYLAKVYNRAWVRPPPLVRCLASPHCLISSLLLCPSPHTNCLNLENKNGSNICKFNTNKISNTQERKTSNLDHPFLANSKTIADTMHNIKERICILSFRFITRSKKE
jgi:hypothetical protein